MGIKLFPYSIKKILLIYLCICITVILFSNIVIGVLAVKPLSEDMRETYTHQLNNASNVFMEKTKSLEILADIITELYFADGNIQMDSGIDKVIKSFMVESNDINGCVLINSDDSFYKYGLENEEIDLIQLRVMCNREVDKTGNFMWYNMSLTENESLSYLYNKYIIASTKFLSDGNVNPPQLYIFIDKNSFSNIIDADDGESIVAIVEQENNVIYSNNETKYREIANYSFENMQKIYSNVMGFYKISEGGHDYTLAVYPLTATNFKFVKIYLEGLDAGYVSRAIAISLLTLLFIILLSYYIYLFICRNYIMPLGLVSDRMKKFCSGEEKERLEYTTNKEVNMIVEGYNHIADNFNQVIYDIKKKEYDKKKFELNALRYQIKPHFLYNTLNSIRILAMSGEQAKVSESIRLLGRILKTMLSGTEQEIKVTEEIDFIKNYISLMQIRFEDCLKVEYSIDEEVSDCTIPALILQPLVENAIEHGLAEELALCGDNAKIFIRAKRNGDTLEIDITDNGIGMSEAKLKEVNANKEVASEKSIGVYNVNSRLKLLYGDKGEVCIDSKEMLYTSVTVKIPL